MSADPIRSQAPTPPTSPPTWLLYGWALLIPLSYATPGLFRQAPTQPLPLVVLIGCTLLALGSVALLLRTPAWHSLARQDESRLWWWVLVPGMLAYFAGSLWVGWSWLHEFSPRMNNLGIFTQSFWTTLHGHPFSNSHETVDGSLGSHLGVHFSPTLLLLLPLYALWPSPALLLAAQSMAVALVPVPIFLLMRKRAGAAAACVLALTILLLPAMFRAGCDDFHDMTFLPVLLLTCLWAAEEGRRGVMLACALAALGMREDASFALAMLGVSLVLRGRRRKEGFALLALALAWFVLVVKLVMPRFLTPGLWMDPSRFFALHLGGWGATPMEGARHILAHPGAFARSMATGERLRYLYQLLRPLLFLPVAGSLEWLAGAPALAATLLSQHPWMRVVWKYHTLLALTFGYLAVARTVGKVAARHAGPGPGPAGPQRAAASLALSVVVLAGVLPAQVFTPVAATRPSPPRVGARQLVAAIPPRVPVYVPVGLYCALAQRDTVGCWDSVHERGREPGLRRAYAWIVMEETNATPGRTEAALAESLAVDPAFRSVAGFEGYRVYVRR